MTLGNCIAFAAKMGLKVEVREIVPSGQRQWATASANFRAVKNGRTILEENNVEQFFESLIQVSMVLNK